MMNLMQQAIKWHVPILSSACNLAPAFVNQALRVIYCNCLHVFEKLFDIKYACIVLCFLLSCLN